jgi:DMSO/TMAO reductase YedYZ molybdopterin-dependent catalytic subunit
MWMLDNPPPFDVGAWKLDITGEVERPVSLSVPELTAAPVVELDATLDCTGGWYTDQRWQGIPVAWLLDRAGPLPSATGVSFVSATGYRWSIPLSEARSLILSTHVGGVALDHGHGAPLRLVAPGRRGFQWVKWVREVRVIEGEDLGQWAVIFPSGL